MARRSLADRVAALEARRAAPSAGQWNNYLDAFVAYCKGVTLGQSSEAPIPPCVSPGTIPPPFARARIDQIFNLAWDKRRGVEQLRTTWVGEYLIGLRGCTPEEIAQALPAEDRAIVDAIGVDAYFDSLDGQT